MTECVLGDKINQEHREIGPAIRGAGDSIDLRIADAVRPRFVPGPEPAGTRVADR